MAPTVSVIIPCWEQTQYLEDSVRSVMAQTYMYWELIIVGDHPTRMDSSPF